MARWCFYFFQTSEVWFSMRELRFLRAFFYWASLEIPISCRFAIWLSGTDALRLGGLPSNVDFNEYFCSELMQAIYLGALGSGYGHPHLEIFRQEGAP